jgi:hypothetical protein
MSNTSANFTIGYKPNDSHHNLLNEPHDGHDSQIDEYIYIDNTTGEYVISGPGVQFGTLRVVPKSEGSSESGGVLQTSLAKRQPKTEVLLSNDTSEDERVGHHPDTSQCTSLDRATGMYYQSDPGMLYEKLTTVLDLEKALGKGERAAGASHEISCNSLTLCGAGKWICGIGARRKQEKERLRDARDRMLAEAGYYV